MEHQATLTYSEPLIRQAVFAFWRRSLGTGVLAAVAVLIIVFCYLLFVGDRSWVVGVLASCAALAIGLPMALFAVHYSNSRQKFRAMGLPRAKLIATESSLSLSSGAGTGSFPWCAVSEVWQFPTFWLLLFSKAQFITLPLADISADAQEFILQRVRAAGGKTG